MLQSTKGKKFSLSVLKPSGSVVKLIHTSPQTLRNGHATLSKFSGLSYRFSLRTTVIKKELFSDYYGAFLQSA